jgi:hypothetical protein
MGEILDRMEKLPSSVYYDGVAGSTLLPLFLYFTGKKEDCIFVGLWAPTILNLGLYNKLLRPSAEPGTPN